MSYNPKLHLTGHETCTRSFEMPMDSSHKAAASQCGQGQAVLAACTLGTSVTGWVPQLVLAHIFPQPDLMLAQTHCQSDGPPL